MCGESAWTRRTCSSSGARAFRRTLVAMNSVSEGSEDSKESEEGSALVVRTDAPTKRAAYRPRKPNMV